MQKANLLSIDTPLLSIACEIAGPEGGRPVILLHGWPDSVRTWDRVLPTLHAAGYQTIVPHLRGCGPTRFHDPGTMRSGQLAALAQDALDLAEALGLNRFALAGHDWGARAAYIASCLHSERITHCAAVSVGWGTNDPDQSLALKQIQNYWYHWYFALERGAELVRTERRPLTRYIWSIWNPQRTISDEEFDATAAAFENEDWADVVVHSYRVRWGLAPKDARYDVAEQRVRDEPRIDVPTLVLHGGSDPCNDPSTSEGKDAYFGSRYRRVVIEGAGHFPQADVPDTVAAELTAFFAS